MKGSLSEGREINGSREEELVSEGAGLTMK